MKKIKHLGILLSSLALVLTSCGNSKFEEVRFNRARRKEIIDAITNSDVIDVFFDAEINLNLRHRYRYFNEDDTISEGDVNGTFIGDLEMIVLNENNKFNRKVDINGDITLGEKSLNDFSNTFYYLNDDRVYHTFSSLDSARKNVYYDLPTFDESDYVDPALTAIKDDLLDSDYEAQENNKLYRITFDLKDPMYTRFYEYAVIYYAQENDKTPSEVTSEERKLIKAYVDASLNLSTLDVTFTLEKKNLLLQNYSLSLGVTLTDTTRTNAASNTYNRYVFNGVIEGNVKYNQDLNFARPITSSYNKSEKGQEILDLLSSVL